MVFIGQKLPSNIKFIAAANPYRVKNERGQSKQKYESGLSYERHHVLAAMELKTHKDVMQRLTYRVHTLPNSLLDYVWDYGYLKPEVIMLASPFAFFIVNFLNTNNIIRLNDYMLPLC